MPEGKREGMEGGMAEDHLGNQVLLKKKLEL